MAPRLSCLRDGAPARDGGMGCCVYWSMQAQQRQSPTPSAQPPGNSQNAIGLDARFRRFIRDPVFPCVGARTALAGQTLVTGVFGRFGDPGGDLPLLRALRRFTMRIDAASGRRVHSFAALYEGPCSLGEHGFEGVFWNCLQRLTELDRARGNAWAHDVSADPAEPTFSLSLCSHPFFVVALHPAASRRARRFERPALVFNSHRQFAGLKEDGRYARMQAMTRGRDRSLQGSINPNLAEFGDRSEARQYSGRHIDGEWICPLRTGRE